MVTSDNAGPGTSTPCQKPMVANRQECSSVLNAGHQRRLGQVATGSAPARAPVRPRRPAAAFMARQLVNRASVRPPAASIRATSSSAWPLVAAAGGDRAGARRSRAGPGARSRRDCRRPARRRSRRAARGGRPAWRDGGAGQDARSGPPRRPTAGSAERPADVEGRHLAGPARAPGPSTQATGLVRQLEDGVEVIAARWVAACWARARRARVVDDPGRDRLSQRRRPGPVDPLARIEGQAIPATGVQRPGWSRRRRSQGSQRVVQRHRSLVVGRIGDAGRRRPGAGPGRASAWKRPAPSSKPRLAEAMSSSSWVSSNTTTSWGGRTSPPLARCGGVEVGVDHDHVGLRGPARGPPRRSSARPTGSGWRPGIPGTRR